MLLCIAPEVVGEDRPIGATAPLADLIDAMRTGGIAAVSDSGVLGDARGATAAEGAELLADMVADLEALLERSL